MVENYSETLYPKDCIYLVSMFFKENLANYVQIKTTSHAGYWWIEYKHENNNLTIIFDGDISGHFTIYIYIVESKYGLWQYDRRVNSASKSNKKNILYQLNVLKQFLDGIYK
jgi:hypothetical protein